MDLATPPQSPQPKNVRLSAIAKKALKRVRSPKKTFESPLEKRKPGSHSDLPLEVRQAAVAEYRAALGPGGTLPPRRPSVPSENCSPNGRKKTPTKTSMMPQSRRAVSPRTIRALFVLV